MCEGVGVSEMKMKERKMLKSIKIEDFVNGEWVNDSNGLLDSVDSSGLWKLKLGDDCVLESIEKLNSIEGRDIEGGLGKHLCRCSFSVAAVVKLNGVDECSRDELHIFIQWCFQGNDRLHLSFQGNDQCFQGNVHIQVWLVSREYCAHRVKNGVSSDRECT